jgi:hypothetical protein
MRSICLGVAVLIGSVFGACAQVTNTQPIGGQSGGLFDDPCHPGDVLVGYDYSAGKSLATLQGVCQAQNNGKLVGATYPLKLQGGISNDFPGADSPRCPAGSAIYSMDIWVNKFSDIDSVDAKCTPLSPADDGSRFPLSRSFSGGEAAGNATLVQCPASTLAVGIIGRSDAVMNSLGLKCSPFPWHVAALPPPTNIMKVIASGDVYDHPGGSGQPKYPDGLDPANTILVYLLEVGLDENVNWYRVTWNGAPPQPLWVFHGEGNMPFDPASLATAKAALGVGH